MSDISDEDEPYSSGSSDNYLPESESSEESESDLDDNRMLHHLMSTNINNNETSDAEESLPRKP